MTYAICKQNENGSCDLLAEGLDRKDAIARATELAKTNKGITVEFTRKSDGQHGFLNRDGNHDVTGRYWS